MSKKHHKTLSEATLQKINRTGEKYERAVEKIEPREYFLIVCEGEKTEPNYFEAISKELPSNLVLVVDGAGANTMMLVNRAKQIDDNRNKNMGARYDHIWIVFDRDSFSAEDFNNAVFMCQNKNYNAAYSNESFELWYLLHFEYLNTGINRKQYIKKIQTIIRKKTGNKKFKYMKNSKNFYDILVKHGDENKAISWSKELSKNWNKKNPAKECPSTYVYRLIEKLRKY